MSDHADIVRNNLEEIASFPLGDGRSQHRARAALAALDALIAERDRWRAVACNVKDGTAAAEARVTELEAALGAVKAWLNQEEEVGLGVPDILWDIILAAAPTKEDTDE